MATNRTSRLLLVRHCAALHQGPEAPLTPAGEEAAARLGEQLASFEPEAIYSSPYLRALATVRPLSERANLSVTQDERLRERCLSKEPLPDWLHHVHESYEDLDYRVHGGESLREVQARGLEVLREIADRHRFAIVASHGQWISAILQHIDRSFRFEGWRTLRNPDLFMVSWESGLPRTYERRSVDP